MRDDEPSAETVSSEAALPTRTEFARRLSGDRRRVYWAIGIGSCAMLLLFAVMFLSKPYFDRAGVPAGSTMRLIPMFVLGPIALLVFFGGIWRADRQSQTKCAACRQSLFSAHDPYVAMVTGRCPKCAAPMFADDLHHFSTEPANRRAPLTAGDALREVGGLAREFRPAIPWVIAGALLLGLGFKAGQLLETEYYSSLLGDVWTAFLKRTWFVPGVFVGSLGMWASVRALNVNAEPCPACGEKVDVWARKTGNCTSCGLPVVGDPFPGLQSRDAMASSLWSVAEYRTAALQRRGRQWIGCLVGAGLAAVWCSPLLIYSSQQPRYHQPAAWELAAYVLTLVGMGVFQCLGVWWWDRRLARGLHCPGCRHELLHSFPLVISSQRCCHCGCQVLETPVPKAAA